MATTRRKHGRCWPASSYVRARRLCRRALPPRPRNCLTKPLQRRQRMAEGMNCCVFSGNLTSDARSKEVNGTEVARYSVAVNGRKDEVTFIQCSHWNPKGVLAYLTKGKSVC